MQSGFTQAQFDLLAAHGGKPAPGGAQGPVATGLRAAHQATKEWAEAVQTALFPLGRVEARRAPLNQAGNITPYSWAKIYPHPDAPGELAYTVGIDADGSFVVKIDTVGSVGRTARAIYEEIRGPSNYESPIATVLLAAEGLELDRDALIAWSIDAIASFTPGYDALVVLLGLEPPLRLVTMSRKRGEPVRPGGKRCWMVRWCAARPSGFPTPRLSQTVPREMPRAGPPSPWASIPFPGSGQ